MNQKKINVRSYLGSLGVIFALMVLTYILTFLIPAGEYARIADANGNMIIDAAGKFTYTQGGLPFWKWLLSPVLVLGAEGNTTLIAVIAFLLVIGGIFSALNECDMIGYMLSKIAHKFGHARYRLMAVVVLFFMLLGSFVGSFEEVVPLVPIVTALAVSLGWDVLTGMGMSLIAVGCGFASGIMNPFTVGVAQKLAGIPMFSGVWLRALSFVCIYALLFAFLYVHAKKVEKPAENETRSFEKNEKLDRAVLCFAVILLIGILLIISSTFVTALQDYTMIIVAVMFLVAGVSASIIAGLRGKALGKAFLSGVAGILPAVLMILMASSIKYILVESKVLDTILYGAVNAAQALPKVAVILFIYLIVLVMNFFIASGSAKAFILIPLIVPIAQIVGISPQLCIVAYAFGDGFSNVFYPTNPALLISLGLADVSYGKYAGWSWKFQALNLVLTSALLLLGLAVGY